MSSFWNELLLVVIASGLSWTLIAFYVRATRALQLVQHPNERSMHSMPVPVGAGLAIVLTTLILWPLWQGTDIERPHVVLLASFAGLAALSWIDDRHALPVLVRLGAQAAVVGFCLASTAPELRWIPTLPLILERVLLGLAWVWFVNLFNFMDGIDGLAGSETVAIALGYLIVLRWAGVDSPLWHVALIIAAATGAYLLWNWHPAKVFMGDAGSIPLGLILGALMIDLARCGYWAAALILPLFFVADATYTLIRRALRGDKPWKAHREHLYQRAVLGGATPPNVVSKVIATNVVLIALAVASISSPVLALALASAVVAALLLHLNRLAPSSAL